MTLWSCSFGANPEEVGRQFVKDHGVNYQGAQ